MSNTVATPAIERVVRTPPWVKGSSIRRIAFGALIVACCLVILFPVYWMLNVALQPEGTSRVPSPPLIPPTITFDNFISIFRDRPMALWLGNSVLVATVCVVVAMPVSLMAGYILSRYRIRIGAIVGVFVLVTQMLPPTMLVVPMYQLFSSIGILNTAFAVMVAHMTMVIPLSVWLLKGFFDAIPIDLEQAAEVDGCNRFQVFYRIALPLTLPGIAATALYSFIVSWNEYIFARTLASPQELWTAGVGLASFRGEYVTLFEPMMAASLVFTIPVFVVFFLLQRHLVSGMLSGSVKG